MPSVFGKTKILCRLGILESSTAVNDATAYAASSNLPKKPTEAGLARNARVFQGFI
jgi:hypothetical protein